jgi:hypothetical protein
VFRIVGPQPPPQQRSGSIAHLDLFVPREDAEIPIVGRILEHIPGDSIPHPERLRALADISLDKLATKLEESEDPDFILEVADKTLARLGYGSGPKTAINLAAATQNVQQNFYVSSEDLEQARERMWDQAVPQLESSSVAVEGELFLADQAVQLFLEEAQVDSNP